MNDIRGERGFALITMLILLALLMALLATHFSMTWIEMATTKSSLDSFVGFYAAEAGLNVRADLVRQAFAGYGQPSGATPDLGASDLPCEGSNNGSGDFACVEYTFQERDVVTYVEETAFSTNPIIVPRGEYFRNLNGHEYHYVVYSTATSPATMPEAVLEMHFKSRLIPVFQFSAFYAKDLEILTDHNMFLEGPIHSNGDIYLGSDAALNIGGQITVGGDLYHGRKDADTCMTGDVRVEDPDSLESIPACSGGRKQIAQSEVTAWNGSIDTLVNPVTAPQLQELLPTAGQPYWDHADLRVVLDLNMAPPEVQVRRADGSVDVDRTVHINTCSAVNPSNTFYDNREGATIQMMDVHMQALLACTHVHDLMQGTPLDDTTDGGLVWHFTVDGPDSAGLNSYGVRIRNGGELIAPVAGAPALTGLTIVTDQAMYIQGNYNSLNKKPAAILADSINVLSSGWTDDAHSLLALTDPNRDATGTAIHAAILAGSDTTGGAEGSAGQDGGSYNGGLTGLIRLHEDWNGVMLHYRGSFVSLHNSSHVDGAWAEGDPYYEPPDWSWGFDVDFEDSQLLPPLSPQFIYLKQELFVRQFEI